MVWATVRSRSCFCWLYRASPSLAAKNIISLILVLTIWWCPCVESSFVLLEVAVGYDQCVLLAKLYEPWPCFILYAKPKFACYSRYFLTSYFCIPVHYNEKDIFFGWEQVKPYIISFPKFWYPFSVQYSCVVQLCLTLCDSMDSSTPGFPIHHQLPKLAQTHVHLVSEAIKPSHPLSSPTAPDFNLSKHQVFSNESVLCIQWLKYWTFSCNISPSDEHPGLISFRMG